MKYRVRGSWVLMGVAAWIAGCTVGGPGPAEGILDRSHRYHEVLEAGFAITPVGVAQPAADVVSVSSQLTQSLYTALFVTAGTTPVISPDDVIDLLQLQGEDGVEAFRDFRGQRILGRPLDADDCVHLSRLLQHRYALFTWSDEVEEGGMEEMDRDYTEAAFANDVRRAAFRVVKGTLYGTVVDLWEAEVMWHAVAPYNTSRLFSEGVQAESELQRARDEGVLDLVSLLWSP